MAFEPSLPSQYDARVLAVRELWWRDHYDWLDELGYTLRPRYQPGWKASWKAGKSHFSAEDGFRISASNSRTRENVLDATRKSDNEMVMLKRISKSLHPYEADIGRYLSTEPLSSDPRNHCCPITEVIQVPDDEDMVILVMPFLREFNEPRFATVGEIVEFLRQIFEGLQFMHSHHVAHRDCISLNIMMDHRPIYPVLPHPCAYDMTRDFSRPVKHLTRTERPTKYYLTDFGLSRRFDADEKSPLAHPIFGGDKTVPEFRGDEDEEVVPLNPFPTDLYYLGNMIKKEIIGYHSNLGFLLPLADVMTAPDPVARPTMDEVVERFQKMVAKMSWWQLRSRAARRKDDWLESAAKSVHHAFRTARFVAARYPAIPTPR